MTFALITSSQIAPCGMNCALCLAQHRPKNNCTGCTSAGARKPPHCITCAIKNCEMLKNTGSRFCFACGSFPCARIRNLDKRYRTKYGMSMIENLNNIKLTGIRKFIRDEKDKWACKVCGSTICVHRSNCLVCGTKRER